MPPTPNQPTTPKWLRERGPWIEGALMLLCIGAGEYGLAIVAYVLAWELLLGPGDWKLRARAMLPALCPVALYLLTHKLLGYGTFGAEVYADPFHTPSGYLKWASTRVPQLITAGFWSIPAATIHVFRFGLLEPFEDRLVTPELSRDEYHDVHVRVAWIAIALAVIVVALARRGLQEQERRTLRALVFGGLLGLLPIAVAPAHSRLLIVAQLGVCTLVAAVLVASVRLIRSRSGRDHLRGAVLLPMAGLLAYAHTINDLRWGHAYLEYIDELQAQNLAAFIEGDVLGPDLEGADVVIINAPSQSIGLYGSFVLDANGWPAPRTWRPLALGGEFPMSASRRKPNVLELATIDGGEWMRTAGELFFRREDQPLVAGDVLAYPSLRVEILAANGGHPTKVRFEFDRPLEHFIFVIATPRGLKRWPVPALGKMGVVPFPRLPPVDDPDAVHFPPPPS
jgi:hypothetical protein